MCSNNEPDSDTRLINRVEPFVPTSYDNQEAREDCSLLEPQNPYSEGGGHYAGFEWAARNEPVSCGGNSDSFINGCEEWASQTEAYKECQGDY